MAENDPEAQALVVEVKVARALEDLGAGRTDLAVKDLTQLRDQNPNSAAIRLGLGRAQIARRDGDAALAELQKAVELDPKNAEAQYQLGYVLAGAEAERRPRPWARSRRRRRRSPATRRTRRRSASPSGPRSSSTGRSRCSTKATAMPGYSDARRLLALGQAYVNLKRYKEAVPALEKATSLAPKQRQAWATLGWAYFGLKDGREASRRRREGAQPRLQGAALFDRLQVEAGEAIK